MYMELVFNVEEDLEPLLRPCVVSLVQGNAKPARSSFQAVIKELQSLVGVMMSSFWPQVVMVCLLKV